MIGTVKSRPNYYEVLGLSPGATREDIANAFASGMSMFGLRPLAEAAEISRAFEVLRDPVKRREYDRSLGLTSKPEPQRWTFAMTQQPATQTFVAPSLTVVAKKAELAKAEPDPKVEAEAKLAALVESLRRLAEPAAPETAAEPEPPAPPPHRVEIARPPMPPARRIELTLHSSDDRPLMWRRPALALGGLLLGAIAVGTVAGLSANGGGEKAAAAEPALTVAVPAARKEAAAPAEEAGAQADLPLPTAPVPRQVASLKLPRAVPAPTPAASQEAIAAPPEATEMPGDPLAVAATAAAPGAVRMPLPDGVIAQTIHRIGYACGSVLSTAPVDGSPGVYDVTCSSGQTYRASPVRGRYHFRRSGHG